MKELKGWPFEPFDGEIGPLGCGMRPVQCRRPRVHSGQGRGIPGYQRWQVGCEDHVSVAMAVRAIQKVTLQRKRW